MSSKKKLVISLSVAAAVLVAAIIAIVAVFAAATQTVQSSFSIKFTASDVACKVDGTWALKEASTGESGSLGTITINASNAKDTYSMDASPEIPLTSEKNYVDLTYTFTKNGSRSFTIKSTKAAVTAPLSMTFLDEEKESLDSVIVGDGVVCEDSVVIIVRITLDPTAFNEDMDPVTVNLAWDLAAIQETPANPAE